MDWIGWIESTYYLLHRRMDVIAYLRGTLARQGSAPVLDFGGGTGRVSLALRGPAASSFVVADPDAVPLSRCPRMLAVHPVRIAITPALPFADESFDAVLIVDTLHHVADARAALAECARCLAPGATLHIVEYRKEAWPVRLFGRILRAQGRSCRFWMPDGLAEALRCLGLETRLVAIDRLRFAAHGTKPLSSG